MELLIASTMMSVLFVGLAAHLQGGLAVWRRVTAMGDRLQRQRVALGQLERDLANAIASHHEDPALSAQFGMTELRWWTVRQTRPQRIGAVELVTYRCARLGEVQGLWRTSQSVEEALTGAEVTPARLMPSCEGVSFQYAYLPDGTDGPLDWHDAWSDPQELPRLVQVTVQLAPGRSIQRVVWIPSGVLKPSPSS